MQVKVIRNKGAFRAGLVALGLVLLTSFACGQTLTFNPHAVTLSGNPSQGSYSSGPISIKASSPWPQYRILLVNVLLGSGPLGFTSSPVTSDLTVAPAPGPSAPGFFASPSSTSLGSAFFNPIPIFLGSAQGTLGSFSISFKFPVLTQATTLQGQATFVMTNLSGPGQMVFTLPITCVIPKWISAKLSGGPITVSSVGLGNMLASSTPEINVQTNDPSGASVSVQLPALSFVNGKGIFPASRIVAEIGNTSASAKSAALAAKLGTGALAPLSFLVGIGMTTKYVATLMQTLFSDQTGSYTGTLVLTATVL